MAYSPVAAQYAALSRLLIAATTRMYPGQRKQRDRDIAVVREMLAQAMEAQSREVEGGMVK